MPTLVKKLFSALAIPSGVQKVVFSYMIEFVVDNSLLGRTCLMRTVSLAFFILFSIVIFF